jgi:hypothetical protein
MNKRFSFSGNPGPVFLLCGLLWPDGDVERFSPQTNQLLPGFCLELYADVAWLAGRPCGVVLVVTW